MIKCVFKNLQKIVYRQRQLCKGAAKGGENGISGFLNIARVKTAARTLHSEAHSLQSNILICGALGVFWPSVLRNGFVHI